MAHAILRDIAARAQDGFRFYVYVLSRPDGTPLYVGKGSGGRVLQHEQDARRKKKNTHLLNVIRKAQRDGRQIGKKVDSFHATKETAYEREYELVLQIGRWNNGTGPLANLQGGGRGGDGYPLDKWRKRNPEAYAESLRRAAEAKQQKEYRQRNAERVRREMAENPGRQRAMVEASQRPEAREVQYRGLLDYVAANREVAQARGRRTGEMNRSPARRRMLSETAKKWFKENPQAWEAAKEKRRQVLASPEYKARREATRQARVKTQSRCEKMIRKWGLQLEVRRPRPDATLRTWLAFEAELVALTGV